MSSEAKTNIAGSLVDSSLRNEIKKLCGENVLACYQCGECTAGCPIAFSMDISPNQVMRMAQLGMRDELLGSSAIWLCAGCETCATRCPRGVALSKVMDACRQIAVKEGRTCAEPDVLKFHEEFLRQVQWHGRAHEIGLIGIHKLRTRNFFADVLAGAQMFLKGKLDILPSRVKGLGEVRGLFRKG